MLSLEDLKELSSAAKQQQANLRNNEQATKNALIEPFIAALGYSTRNTNEVAPEYPVTVGNQTQRADYAILRDGNPIILFECKSLDTPLNKDMPQLYQYFTPTPAHFGVLTNGVVYRFFSDLKTPNVMDQTHFWEVDIRSADEGDVVHLRQFAKDNFDVAGIKASAVATNILTGVKANIQKMYDNPDDEFSKTLFRNLVAGDLEIKFAMSHRELVKRAFHEFVSDRSSTGNGGEFSQGMSAGAPQSVPGQAAEIPSSPPPVAQQTPPTTPAPTDGWQPLSDIRPNIGDPNPRQMMLPDNTLVAIPRWSWVGLEAFRWLTNNGHLGDEDVPIPNPHNESRYIVADQPIHPKGNKFIKPQKVSTRYVEMGGVIFPQAAENARSIIKLAGMDASQFKVRW